MAFEKVIENFPDNGTEKMVRDRFAKYKVELSRVFIDRSNQQVQIVAINDPWLAPEYMVNTFKMDWNSRTW